MSFNHLREKKTSPGVIQFLSGVGTCCSQLNDAVFLQPLNQDDPVCFKFSNSEENVHMLSSNIALWSMAVHF